MKNLLWMVTGICAASVGLILFAPRRSQPVQELANRLQQAWADHHTVV